MRIRYFVRLFERIRNSLKIFEVICFIQFRKLEWRDLSKLENMGPGANKKRKQRLDAKRAEQPTDEHREIDKGWFSKVFFIFRRYSI